MKKRIGLALLAATFTLTLASCNSNISFIETSETYPTNAATEGSSSTTTQTKSETKDPEYHSPSVSYTTTTSTSASTSVEDTVALVYDSVVSITASSLTATSAGSGVLFAEDSDLGLSYLVTCFHVIEDASIFSITLSDGTEYDAQLVGGYEDMDLAVMSVEATGLTYASIFDDSDTLKLGSSVVCIGNPLGTLPGSVSAGVVSYVNRSVQTDTYTYRTLIQTDVAINSGNSGGGLFNTAGALIGIVNAKYSSEGIEGLGFAIPSNDVKSTITSLLATAKYDSANKCWSTGYVAGDYEYGFTLTLGYYSTGMGWNSSRTYVYYVSEVDSNTTATGASELEENDIVTEVKVDYADTAKTDEDFTVSAKTDVNEFLYGLSLSLDDTLYFTVTRSGASQTIAVDVVQFVYSI